MAETSSFQAGSSMSDLTSSEDESFKASMPSTTLLNIPEYPEPHPKQSVAATPHITMTTIIIVGCVITSCVILALLVAAILRQKRSRVKRVEDETRTKTKSDKSSDEKEKQVDTDIYSEIEPMDSSCCLCLCRRDMYSVSSRDHIDNIYAEVSDIVPTTQQDPNTKKEVIYETLDGKDWSRSRSKSQGANDVPKTNMPPKIYDHLSFQELERLRLENGGELPGRRKVVRSTPEQMSTAYDRLDRSPPNLSTSGSLDNADGNNNSLVRRLSQKQILKKLFVVENECIQRHRLSPTKRHDYFEVENVPRTSDTTEESTEFRPALGHDYFLLEDVCKRKPASRREKPPVPIRGCSLRPTLHGERCVSFPGRSVPVAGSTGRRVKSFPDRPEVCSSRETIDHISMISSVVSSEGVYNIKTGHAQRFSSDGRQQESDVCLRSPRNDYFVLDPVFVNSDASSLQSEDDDSVSSHSNCGRRGDYFTLEPEVHVSPSQPTASGYRNDYFVLEPETRDDFRQPARFHIVEENEAPSFSYRHFSRQVSEPCRRDSGGVTVVKLTRTGNDDTSCETEPESLYDRLRFKSASAKHKSDYRPRLLSTPNNIDF